MKRYPDCQYDEGGSCAACSLSNYNLDCHNNPVNTLAFHRKRCGLSQQKLADAAGVQRSQIGKYEGGVYSLANLTLASAVAIAGVLGITAEDLLDE